MAQALTTSSTRVHDITAERQPGHWLLASLGKRVLRPGGLELTRWMLSSLAVGTSDDVVEFAPGLGITARMVLEASPRHYTAIERDSAAAQRVLARLHAPNHKCLQGTAENTGLPAESATVVYGEAMLSMQTPEQKARIAREAIRVLKPGGRYGIHELCLTPNTIAAELRREIAKQLSMGIHVGVQPLTSPEWRKVLEEAGFRVQAERQAPMHLLEPGRMLRDEGVLGALRIILNAARKPAARRRMMEMRNLFRRYQDHLAAISLVAVKP